MLLETLDSIIGQRSDPELTQTIKDIVAAFPGVRGVYDLALHNYGPTQIIGEAHIEVPDAATAREYYKKAAEFGGLTGKERLRRLAFQLLKR